MPTELLMEVGGRLTLAAGKDRLNGVPISNTLDREVAMTSHPVIRCQGGG